MKLSFGIGMAFVPFGLAISTEYVLAANTGTNLSELAATVFSPYVWAAPLGGLSQGLQDEAPTQALPVLEDATEAGDIDRAELAQGKKRPSQGRTATKPSPSAADKPLPALFVPSATVLRIANAGQRPSGKPVTADRKRPAGVQVFGASSLGVGVRDGDVITRVSGVPVTSPNQIIALVIAARGARTKAISAQVFRGQRSYTLTVEQPYLNDPDAHPSHEADPKP